MGKRVLLVGGKDKCRALATSLISKGYQVSAINKNYDDCISLGSVDKLNVFFGDGTKSFVLADAEADKCDIAIALATKDEDNLVICELCKKEFGVKKTLSLLSDPAKKEFFYQMGIDSVICAITAITGIIEQQAFIEEMGNAVSIGGGKIKIDEVEINKSDKVVGKKLSEIVLPNSAIIGSILRGDQTIVPRGDTKIMVGDLLVLLTSNNVELEAIKALKGE